MKAAQPSNLEMQILSVLWDHGPLTARAVLERMPDEKPRAYTTVLSVLQVMEKKGLVTHDTDGNRHIYSPNVKQKAVVGPLLKSLVKTVFGGRPANAMQHLLDAAEVTPGEIAQIRALLDQHSARTQKGEKQ